MASLIKSKTSKKRRLVDSGSVAEALRGRRRRLVAAIVAATRRRHRHRHRVGDVVVDVLVDREVVRTDGMSVDS